MSEITIPQRDWEIYVEIRDWRDRIFNNFEKKGGAYVDKDVDELDLYYWREEEKFYTSIDMKDYLESRYEHSLEARDSHEEGPFSWNEKSDKNRARVLDWIETRKKYYLPPFN